MIFGLFGGDKKRVAEMISAARSGDIAKNYKGIFRCKKGDSRTQLKSPSGSGKSNSALIEATINKVWDGL